MRHKRLPAYTFTIKFPAPLDIPASLDIFRRTGDDGLDRWDGRVLVRTTRVADTVVPFTGTVVGTVDAPAMVVTVAHATHVPVVEHTVRTMFVTAPAPLAELIAIDPVIAGLEARYPGLRPVLQFDPLTALIRAISVQQVNLRWATTTRRRLAEAFGCQHTRLPAGLQPCCRTSRRCRCHGPTRLTIDHTQSGIHRCTGHCSSHRAARFSRAT